MKMRTVPTPKGQFLVVVVATLKNADNECWFIPNSAFVEKLTRHSHSLFSLTITTISCCLVFFDFSDPFHPHTSSSISMEPDNSGCYQRLVETLPLLKSALSAPAEANGVKQARIDLVLQNASEWGFFLHPNRIRAAGSIEFHTSSRHHCSPALVETIIFIGECIISHRLIEALRDSALLHVACAMSSPAIWNPVFIDLLQAFVLLAHFSIATGDLKGAAYQVYQARLIADSARLNLPPTVAIPPWHAATDLAGSMYALPPPADVIQQQERMDAFWAIFNLVNILNLIAPKIPLGLADVDQIAIPFPGTIGTDAYTVRSFINGAPFPSNASRSMRPEAFLTRATVILRQAMEFSAGDPSQRPNVLRLQQTIKYDWGHVGLAIQCALVRCLSPCLYLVYTTVYCTL
ncbi:hypothetical protein HGRIS_005321 [Hohenbuehelia grisea]|uniref:Transcription factor domain-containing protein n=1 Tax=Hohenbuehelia grisea TaxID=104357 RepID=A0ABR3JFI8_9AGAR